MAYFNSTDVGVFPSAYRSSYSAGKFTSELNMTNMIKALAQRPSFVVGMTSTTLKIVVGGYYFEIANFQVSSHQNTDVEINVIGGYLMSVDDGDTTLDESDLFEGLKYTDNVSGDPVSTDTKLSITRNGELVNQGYISNLVDENGN